MLNYAWFFRNFKVIRRCRWRLWLRARNTLTRERNINMGTWLTRRWLHATTKPNDWGAGGGGSLTICCFFALMLTMSDILGHHIMYWVGEEHWALSYGWFNQNCWIGEQHAIYSKFTVYFDPGPDSWPTYLFVTLQVIANLYKSHVEVMLIDVNRNFWEIFFRKCNSLLN